MDQQTFGPILSSGTARSWLVAVAEPCMPVPRHFLLFFSLYCRIRLGRLNLVVGSNPAAATKFSFVSKTS
jgi:hypothetical protein